MGTCLSTQSAGRVSISPSSAEHAEDRNNNNNNNCGGRSGDDSGSPQQQGGSGSNSDSVTSTSPAAGGGLGPSTTTTRGGGGEQFPPESGQSSSCHRCSAPSAADGATSSPRSNCDLERRLSNHPAPTPAADGCGVPGGAQGDDDSIGKVTSLSHNTPPIPPQRDQFITKESVFMGEGGELREEGRVSSSRPYDVEPTLMHSHNAHLAGSIDDNEVFPNDAHDDRSRLTLDQLCLKSVEEERLEVSSVRFTATASSDLPVASEQPESCGGYNRDHQSLVRSTSACSGMDSGSSPSGGGDSIAGGGRSGENGSRVVFLQQTVAVVVEAPFGHLQHRPRSITSSSLAMLDVLRTNNPNQGDNSPSAVLSTVDYSPPSNFVFDSARVGVGGGGGGSGGASVHGDPQLGPSMCSSWDSGDCYRARISMADAQSTMQTVATASLFTSRNL